jgi:diguanylate cyclase (GGDEF)-like protein
VFNRRAVFDAMDREWSRCKRYGRPLTLLILDLDHFKAVNDRHGHLVGDRVLQQFARNASQVLRPHDTLGPYGGEEFLVVMPETDAEAAITAAERIRLAAQIGDPGLPAHTVSIGVAQFLSTPCRGRHAAR